MTKTKSKKVSDSFYSKSKMVENRTINYRFSVLNKQDKAYTDLKAVIKEHNEGQQEVESLGVTPHYLKVRGRGRAGTRTFNGVTYSHCIPDKFAKHFDVYVVHDKVRIEAAIERIGKSKTAMAKAKDLAKVVTTRTADIMDKIGIAA